ncbi:MAG: TauD/TfdA family dioxygenase [Crocinitomicaceae bacterium]|nr:TauD/TfdA family dioxygenase [Crocinitomicaceae bacterium]
MEDSLKDLTWEKSLPDINDLSITIPQELVEPCPNIIIDEEIDPNLLSDFKKTLPYKRLIDWSKSNLSAIMSSPGFSLLKVSDYKLDNDKLKSLYYIIALGLGTLNDRYGDLFDVRDKKLDYKKEAIPVSKTNASTGFHTDSTALEYSPDIVGLLCLQPAKIGGESILANAADLYLWMKQLHPEDLDILSRPIIRDVITPGSQTDIEAIKKNRFPVFSFVNDSFKFRFMKYWIISGHNRCNLEIPMELKRALDRIDDFFKKKDNLSYYSMVRGDILFVNNNFICHNRTKYEDYDEPERKRILVRTWINQ